MDVNNKRFWELLKPEHARAQHFCRGLTGNREDGDDLYQESVLAALRKFPQLKSENSFRGWLYRIVINSYRNRRRNWWFKRVVHFGDSTEFEPAHDPRTSHAERQLVEKLLNQLSPRDRALITLFEIEGWTIRQLSELFRVSEGATKVRLSRIRSSMRKRLLQLEAKAESTRIVKMIKENVCVAGKSEPN